jgi:hypothetical protein
MYDEASAIQEELHETEAETRKIRIRLVMNTKEDDEEKVEENATRLNLGNCCTEVCGVRKRDRAEEVPMGISISVPLSSSPSSSSPSNIGISFVLRPTCK